MSGNLPPGVTDGMIPGNRPEDAAQERFMEKLGEALRGIMAEETYFSWSDVPSLLVEASNDIEDNPSDWLPDEFIEAEES